MPLRITCDNPPLTTQVNSHAPEWSRVKGGCCYTLESQSVGEPCHLRRLITLASYSVLIGKFESTSAVYIPWTETCYPVTVKVLA
jgi:hypothetical protein